MNMFTLISPRRYIVKILNRTAKILQNHTPYLDGGKPW